MDCSANGDRERERERVKEGTVFDHSTLGEQQCDDSRECRP